MNSVRNNSRITGLRADNSKFSTIWFAARPYRIEDIYKIYAESFLGNYHLRRMLEGALMIVSDTLAGSP